MAINVPEEGVPQKSASRSLLTPGEKGILSTAASNAEAAWVTAMEALLVDPDRSFGSSGKLSASLSTNLTGANNDLVFTAKSAGVDGNDISVTYADPGGASATLGVSVTDTDITVNLGRTASAIDTTATALKAAIDGDSGAAALVSVANKAGNDGSGLVTAMSKTNLSGGDY